MSAVAGLASSSKSTNNTRSAPVRLGKASFSKSSHERWNFSLTLVRSPSLLPIGHHNFVLFIYLYYYYLYYYYVFIYLFFFLILRATWCTHVLPAVVDEGLHVSELGTECGRALLHTHTPNDARESALGRTNEK